MANIFVPSVAPQLAVIGAQITTVDTVVDAIRAVDVPGLSAEHGVIDAVVDAIRATDITTITNAIANKSIRGGFEFAYYDAVPGDTNYHDVVNENTPGKLFVVIGKFITSGGQVRITIDGEVSNPCTLAVATNYYIGILKDATSHQFDIQRESEYVRMEIEFTTALRVEIKQGTGTNHMSCVVLYQLD